jgi:hypothetical protein
MNKGGHYSTGSHFSSRNVCSCLENDTYSSGDWVIILRRKMTPGHFSSLHRLFWPSRSISIYHISLNEFEQRIKKLVLHVFVCIISKARACIFRKNDYRSKHRQMLGYHPGKFHVDPFYSFREHSRTKKYRRRHNRVKTCSLNFVWGT